MALGFDSTAWMGFLGALSVWMLIFLDLGGTGKSKVLSIPHKSRKVSIQTDKAPTKPIHAVESKPSTIVFGFSVNLHCQPHSESPV